MPRETTEYSCVNCGYRSPKWMGRCPECAAWDSLERETVQPKKTKGRTGKNLSLPVSLGSITKPATTFFSTRIGEFDRVLGGGFTKDSTVLIAGDPGIGKSTLLLQALQLASIEGITCLYITGEESPQQIKIRAQRLDSSSENLLVLAETNVERIIEIIEQTNPKVATIDSIQTLYSHDITSIPGSITQIRESAYRLIQIAKEKGFCIFFVGHITKDGQIAGPMALEHMVDTVIYFEGDPKSQHRILRAIKNRFGTTNEIGIFEMAQEGLREISNPSRIFLNETSRGSPGSVIMANMEGSRAFLIEVQALCTKSAYTVAGRISTGIDRNRVCLLTAILEKKIGLNLSNQDIYVNITGGFKLHERAGDLAVACAIASSFTNRAIAQDTFVFGEIGLAGETRPCKYPLKRITEGEKLGFKTCILPFDNLKGVKTKGTTMELLGLKSIEEVLDKIL